MNFIPLLLSLWSWSNIAFPWQQTIWSCRLRSHTPMDWVYLYELFLVLPLTWHKTFVSETVLFFNFSLEELWHSLKTLRYSSWLSYINFLGLLGAYWIIQFYTIPPPDCRYSLHGIWPTRVHHPPSASAWESVTAGCCKMRDVCLPKQLVLIVCSTQLNCPNLKLFL